MSDYDDDTQPSGQYEGWSNWDTWNANLWLTNDEAIYKVARAARDHQELRSVFRSYFYTPATDQTHPYVDGINPDDVNWQEIYDSLHEGD